MPTHLLVVRMSFTPQLKKRNVLEDLSNHCAPNQLGSLKNLLLSLLDEMNDTSSLIYMTCSLLCKIKIKVSKKNNDITYSQEVKLVYMILTVSFETRITL